MQDMINCPICGDKMRSVREHKSLFPVGKTANYCERTCNGLNHVIQFMTDENTKQIDFLKISLEPDYSKFIYIDLFNEKCQVILLGNNKKEIIDIPRIIFPDFPNLIKLKEKVNLLTAFS